MMQPQKNKRKRRARPFSAERTKEVVCKVIFFYSIFYIVMKILAMFNHEQIWIVPNLILCIPFVIFGLIGYWMTRQNRYSWIYLILGILVISAIRFFETDLMVYLAQHV